MLQGLVAHGHAPSRERRNKILRQKRQNSAERTGVERGLSEMSNYPRTSFSLEERLNEVIAAYIQAVDAGKRPSQQEILAQHPDLAGLLKDFFADHDRMRQAAVPFQPANPAEAPTLAPGGAKPADGALVRV